MQAEKQESVQQAYANSSQEICQLKATVLAMREEMEQMHFEKQRSLQQAAAERLARTERLPQRRSHTSGKDVRVHREGRIELLLGVVDPFHGFQVFLP